MPNAKIKIKRTSASTVLQSSDFTYEGAFYLPTALGDASDTYFYGPGFGGGLTHRYRSGTLNLLLTATTVNKVYAVTVPTLKTSAYNTASIVKEYGDVYSSKRVNNDPSNGLAQYGIHWDETDQRLYWSYGNLYTSVAGPSIGCSTLDDATPSGTGIGTWAFSGLGFKAVQSGVLPIPSSFAAAYTFGRRLGVGFGGYYSITGSQDVSIGPSLTAIDPPNLGTNPNLSALNHTRLVGYDPFADPGTSTRCHRPSTTPALDQHLDSGSNTNWSWVDCPAAAVWIHLPTKQGLLYITAYGCGYASYINSAFGAETEQHYWTVYDEAQLALVAQGSLSRDAIQPASQWSVQYADYNYAVPPFALVPKTVTSITASGSDLTVTCTAHGYAGGQRIHLTGANEADFNGGFQVTSVTNANVFVCSNNGIPSYSAGSATGTLRVASIWSDFHPAQAAGATFDSTTNRLYLLQAIGGATQRMVVYVWSVN
jgi:hypothetical protein